ncbi:acyltransferase family protein [Curtobacterium pusillum]|uniref:acyltransferase family protein n=1 Tax=Curtobacterium pusillum TaxID=69373 RepID=UPI0011A65E31|nr:acyltransferase family protein [Curtobacterium pusillum]
MTGPGRRRDVQGLRGIAVLLVVAQHVLGKPSGGFVGVDLFFVISGYVITRSLLGEWRESGRIDLAGFLTGRARRLLPSAVLVLACTSAAALFLFNESRARSVGLDALAGVTSAANWHFLRAGADYFGPDTPSPLLHFWSLSVEEQFYVIFPVLLIGALEIGRRGHQPRLAVLLIAGAVAGSIAVAVLESSLRPAAAYFTTESRAWEFGVGALVALLARHSAELGAVPRRMLGALGAAGITLASLTSVGTSFPFPGAALPVFAAAAVLAAGEAGDGPWSSKMLGTPPLVLIGDLSYVIYLWHLPLLTFIEAIAPGSHLGPVMVFVVLLATGAAAWLTHRYIEQPLRRRRSPSRRADLNDERRTAHGGVERATAVGLVLVVVVGSGVQAGGGTHVQGGPRPLADDASSIGLAPFTTDAQLSHNVGEGLALRRWPSTVPDITTITAADGEASRLAQCLHDPATVDQLALRESLKDCSWGASDGPVLAVFGDSIALGWTAGAVHRYVAEGWRVVAVGLQSCATSDVAVPDRTGRPDFVEACKNARTIAIEFIAGLGARVILTSSSVGAFDRQHQTTSSGRSAAWQAGLVRTLRKLALSGPEVFVLGAPPEGSDPSVCATRMNDPRNCLTIMGTSRKSMAIAEAAAVRELGSSARYVQTDRWFCDDDGRCPLVVDGTVVRADRGHITTAFSERLARVLPVVGARD